MAFRKLMEDSELWLAVGCIEAAKQLPEEPVDGHPGITTPAESRCISFATKRNQRSTSTRVKPMVAAAIGKTIC
ncbi:hypothetical protein TNCV_4048191 [Trichonephila clavipes]|nr:hypothetical protein TNCV_4048191 [Trichonephila clavipes]